MPTGYGKEFDMKKALHGIADAFFAGMGFIAAIFYSMYRAVFGQFFCRRLRFMA